MIRSVFILVGDILIIGPRVWTPIQPSWIKSGPRYPLDRCLGGPQVQSGLCGVEKTLRWESIPDSPVIHPVAWLLHERVTHSSYITEFILS
jgi:hypothetical protein